MENASEIMSAANELIGYLKDALGESRRECADMKECLRSYKEREAVLGEIVNQQTQQLWEGRPSFIAEQATIGAMAAKLKVAEERIGELQHENSGLHKVISIDTRLINGASETITALRVELEKLKAAAPAVEQRIFMRDLSIDTRLINCSDQEVVSASRLLRFDQLLDMAKYKAEGEIAITEAAKKAATSLLQKLYGPNAVLEKPVDSPKSTE